MQIGHPPATFAHIGPLYGVLNTAGTREGGHTCLCVMLLMLSTRTALESNSIDKKTGVIR